jgi:hypothetical protein
MVIRGWVCVAGVAGLVLAGCGCGATASRTTAACRADQLQVRGGRQGGGFQTAHADAELTDLGSPCRLAGAPRLTILDNAGRVLASAPGLTASTTLAHSGHAWLAFSWSNLCRSDPGALRLAVGLPHQGGTVVGGFGGPPDYDYLPGCADRSLPSAIEPLTAW